MVPCAIVAGYSADQGAAQVAGDSPGLVDPPALETVNDRHHENRRVEDADQGKEVLHHTAPRGEGQQGEQHHQGGHHDSHNSGKAQFFSSARHAPAKPLPDVLGHDSSSGIELGVDCRELGGQQADNKDAQQAHRDARDIELGHDRIGVHGCGIGIEQRSGQPGEEMERIDRGEDDPHQHHRHHQGLDIFRAERALDDPLVAAKGVDPQEEDRDDELVVELAGGRDEIHERGGGFLDYPGQPAYLAGDKSVAHQRADQDQDELGRIGENDADHAALESVDPHHDRENQDPPVEIDLRNYRGAGNPYQVHPQAQLPGAFQRVHHRGDRMGLFAVAQAHELGDRGQVQAAEPRHDKQAAESESHVAGPLVPDDADPLVGRLPGLGDEVVHPQVAGGQAADHQGDRHLTVGEVEIIGIGHAAREQLAQAQHEGEPDEDDYDIDSSQHNRSVSRVGSAARPGRYFPPEFL